MFQNEPPTLGQIIYDMIIRPSPPKPCDREYLREQVHICLMTETEIGNCARVVHEYRSCVSKIDKHMK
jgi:hypothetical protein